MADTHFRWDELDRRHHKLGSTDKPSNMILILMVVRKDYCQSHVSLISTIKQIGRFPYYRTDISIMSLPMILLTKK